mgnify:CR=1 FL=1
MKTKFIGVWAFILGLILAMAGVFFDLGGWGHPVMIVLGILVGIFHPVRKDLVPLGVVYLTIATAAAAMDALPYLGPIITGLATAWAQFLGPVALTAMLMWGSPYLISKE